jgi:hypothetical protein
MFSLEDSAADRCLEFLGFRGRLSRCVRCVRGVGVDGGIGLGAQQKSQSKIE